MKKTLRILFLSIIISILPIVVFAEDLEQLQIIDCPEYTDEYRKWLELPDEEKTNYIEPQIYKESSGDDLRRDAKVIQEDIVGNANLPQRFERNYYGTVKNQGNTDACWAYSATTVFESNYFFTTNTRNDFSPMHMEYATSKDYNTRGFNRTVNSGGNINIALAYATNGIGLVRNSVGNTITSELIKNTKSTQKVSDYIELKGQQQIKNYIYQYGVVSAYTYSHRNYFSNNELDYNDNLAYCCNNEAERANHAITIIGWDDEYTNSSFPGKKGAYIVLNSYGASFGNNGKYYIMYEDKFLSDSEAVFYGVTKTNDIDYDNIYQYDEYGCISNLTMSSSIYAANVFDRKNTNENEQLTEISFYLPMTQKVDIYVNSNNKDLNIAKATKNFTTQILDKGYHTIKLDTPLNLTGNDFAVIIKYSNIIPIERKNNNSASWCYTVTSNSGESFISSNRYIIL